MPSPATEEEDEEVIEDRHAVEVLIRATDLDRTKKGWAGVVSQISDRRTRLQLDPHIFPEELLGKRSVIADITVIYKYNDKGIQYPSLYFIREIIKSTNKKG